MLKKIVLRPYPITIHLSLKLYYAIGTSCFTAFFLFFIRPFSLTDDFSITELVYLSGYSLITGTVFFICESLLPRLQPKIFKDSRWTFLHQIVFSLVVLLAIVITILIIQWVSGAMPSLPGVFKYVFTIGAFVIIAFTFLDERFLLRQRIAKYSSVDIRDNEVLIPPVIQISGQSPKEELSIPVNEFLYAVADGNYVTVYWLRAQKLERAMIRQTIKNLQGQLADYKQIVQTHRSYIINTLNIESVSGNKNGREISLKGIAHTVPLSRSYMEKTDINTLRPKAL